MNEPADFWHVYILKCCDGSLYTGIAKDVAARVKKHNSGQGAKYTRSRLPVDLLYTPGICAYMEARGGRWRSNVCRQPIKTSWSIQDRAVPD
ncbi:GIY-YIG nuclease family protein [endosymbiont of Lamellibrachia barhami]|uniref:GIY-YIG nuclease family protein n=1 Tax=endosymbiont of Lamellibrachia barhami TaxID=205975 RepID=UPI0015AAB933